MSRLINPGMRLPAYVDHARSLFRMADANADGVVSAEDSETLKTQSATGSRASTIGDLLRYDINGDGW